MAQELNYKKHLTAEVSSSAKIGKNTRIWNQAQVRENSIIGDECVLGKNVYVDVNVKICNNVKIQNNVSVYQGVTLEEGVFVGPQVCFTNDLNPRAINSDGGIKNGSDWELSKTLIKKGASIGASSTVLCGITVGEFALIGAGSIVTKDVPDHGLVYGNPAKLKGFVCFCGFKADKERTEGGFAILRCKKCGSTFNVKKQVYECIK